MDQAGILQSVMHSNFLGRNPCSLEVDRKIRPMQVDDFLGLYYVCLSFGGASFIVFFSELVLHFIVKARGKTVDELKMPVFIKTETPTACETANSPFSLVKIIPSFYLGDKFNKTINTHDHEIALTLRTDVKIEGTTMSDLLYVKN